MPRKAYKISDFSGGINNHSDSKDLIEGQLSDAVDVDVSNKGIISNMGKPVNATQIGNDTEMNPVNTGAGIKAGQGLHSFSSDRTVLSSLGANLSVELVAAGVSDQNAKARIVIPDNNRVANSGDLFFVIRTVSDGYIWDVMGSGTISNANRTSLYVLNDDAYGSNTSSNIADNFVTAFDGGTGKDVKYGAGGSANVTMTCVKTNLGSNGHEVEITFGNSGDGTGANGIEFEVKMFLYQPTDQDITWSDGYGADLRDGNGNSYYGLYQNGSMGLAYICQDNSGAADNFSIGEFHDGTGAVKHKMKITATAPSSGTHIYRIYVNGVQFLHSSNTTSDNTLASGIDGVLDVGSASAPTTPNNLVDAGDSDPANMNINGTTIGISVASNVVTLESTTAGASQIFSLSAFTSAIATTNVSDNHIVFCDKNGTVHLYHSSINSWDTPGIDVNSTAAGTVQPRFYSDSSALRVCDSDFSHADQTSKWYGYINTGDMFVGGSNTFSIEQWSVEDVSVVGASADYEFTADMSGTSGGATDWVSDNGGTKATKFHLNLLFTGSSTDALAWGGDTGDKYKFYITAIYDGSQESVPVITSSEYTATANQNLEMKVRLGYGGGNNPTTTNYIFPKRQTAARLYFAKESEGYGQLYSLATFDFKDGLIRADGQGDVVWQDYDATGSEEDQVMIASGTNGEAITFAGEYLLDPFEELNGFRPTEETITVDGWKTSAISGRRMFLGNVKYNGVVFNDRMIVSPYNRFDIFPSIGIMDVAVNDGEEIKKIEAYADRILQFKRNTLYIINVSQLDQEFVEDTHKFKGVLSHEHTIKTQYGIAWVNEYGAYLYNGDSLSVLTESEEGGRLIDEDTWGSFITSDSILGYHPSSHKLIVLRSCKAGTNTGDIYVYNFLTNAWTFGDSRFKDSVVVSNFITRADGEMIQLRESNFNDEPME